MIYPKESFAERGARPELLDVGSCVCFLSNQLKSCLGRWLLKLVSSQPKVDKDISGTSLEDFGTNDGGKNKPEERKLRIDSICCIS